MGNAYTPGLKVTPRTVVRKTRRLPLAGDLLVGVGDRVTARQVVARTALPGKVFPINVANQLGLVPEELGAAMRKKAGEQIAAGDVLAETRSFFGLFSSRVTAPVTGSVETVSKVTGQVLLREPPMPVEIRAFVDGVIVETLPGEGVVVETEAACVQGIFGLAGEVHAPLVVLAERPDQVIDADRIEPGHAGRILIGGARLTLAALRRCLALGVSGVVCGGFAYQDLRELLGRDLGVAITGHEDLATTLVVTEGFGDIAMAAATHALLVAHAGRAASMTGATQIRAGVIRPEIIIGGDEVVATVDRALPGLSVGAPVRCVRAPWFGRLGTISGLPAQLVEMPSETRVRVVEVELTGGETIVLPRANVELIEA